MSVKKPKLLLVEDDEGALFGFTQFLIKSGYETTSATCLKDARRIIESELFDAVLLDLNLPDGNSIEWITELRTNFDNVAIIVITGNSDIRTAVRAMQFGADNFLIKPVNMEELDIFLRKSLEIEELRKRNSRYKLMNRKKIDLYFGTSTAIRNVLDLASSAAASDATVLIQGETGSGKGVLARWIHDQSQRKNKPFVELNCSTLQGDLLRSELFGHAKGAFTSAVKDRLGLVDAADEGTLFLDEIGDMGLEVQTQLLKTIEEKTYRRIGENRIRNSDFRLICATNQDLSQNVKRNTFRSDLYFRICIFPITLPPLTKRKKDIPGLVEHILNSFSYTHLPVKEELVNVLTEYSWPGNIRELKNMLERALLLAKNEPLNINHFPGMETMIKEPVASEVSWDLDKMEESHIIAALRHFNDDKYKTSSELGISLSSLYRKLEKIKR